MSQHNAEKELMAARALKESLAVLVQGDPDLLLDSIEGETNLLECIDALIDEIDEAELLRAGIKARKQSLDERDGRLERRIKLYRGLIQQALEIAGRDKLERPSATPCLTKLPQKVIITEEPDIPVEFWKSEPALDRRALGEALKAGRLVPGATLSNGGIGLTIRRA